MDRCKIFARISQREIISTKFCHLSIKYRKSECGYRLSGEDAFAVRKSEVGQLSITMFFCKALLSRPPFWHSWLSKDALEIKLQRRKHANSSLFQNKPVLVRCRFKTEQTDSKEQQNQCSKLSTRAALYLRTYYAKELERIF